MGGLVSGLIGGQRLVGQRKAKLLSKLNSRLAILQKLGVNVKYLKNKYMKSFYTTKELTGANAFIDEIIRHELANN